MRVIEDRCPFSAAMAKKGKRRSSQRNATANSNLYNSLANVDGDSTDGVIKRTACSHISKSVNMSACRKALKTAHMQCSGCAKESVNNAENNSDLQSIWFCLQCGYQGCGRTTLSQHSLKHYEQPHSDSHNIVVNVYSEMVWCYECDDEIPPHTNKPITDMIALIRKQLGINHSKHSRPNSSEMVISTEPTTTCAPHQSRRNRNGSGGAVVLGVATKSFPKMKGLPNLGNTCFFNAVIQSLCQVGELNELLADMRHLPGYTTGSTCSASPLGSDYEDSETDDHKPCNLPPLKINLSKERMALTDSLVKLFRDLNSVEDGGKQTVKPGVLFHQLCQKVPRFKGYQQQDSHELLRNLLDALKTEEMKGIQAGILNTFDYKNLDDQEKKQVVCDIKSYGRQANHTTVDSLFGGYLLSTVLCTECGKASQIFEPFLDLSLPVYEEKGRHTIPKKGFKSIADTYMPVEERRGPSKYQQKKAAKNAKKAKKKNKQTPVQAQDKTIPADDEPSTASSNLLTTTTTSTHSITDSELGRGRDQGDVTPVTSSASASTLVEHTTDNHSQTSRSTTPKSELGYNTDSEGDSGDGIANGSLSHSLEKLSLTGGTTACNGMDSSKSKRIRDAVDMSLKPLSDRLDCAIHECSILSSLGLFTHPELLTGSNKFACSFCNKKAKRRTSPPNEKSLPTVYTNARKQLLIYSPPAILTLHLKRFQQNGYTFSKVNRHVEFSISLDLAPFCSTLSQGVEAGQTSVNYLLFGVVEHSGRLNGGHYTAYVRHRSSATLHKNMLQKSLSNQTPLTVLLERVASLQTEMEIRDMVDGTECSKEEMTSTDINGIGAHCEQIKAQQPLHRWYHISDTHVKEVSERSVLSSQAYLLFYERVS